MWVWDDVTRRIGEQGVFLIGGMIVINHDQYSEPVASDDNWDESLRQQGEP